MSARAKITFCAYDKPDNLGGPVSWLARLLPALRQRGLEVNCLFLMHWGEEGPALTPLREQGLQCDYVLAHPHARDRVRWILERLRENPPDVFVPNLVVAAYHATRWLKPVGIPSTGVLHSDDPFYHALLHEFAVKPGRRQLDSLVCVSRELEQQARARAPQTITVRRIPYGVTIPREYPDYQPGRLRLLYVGRLAEEQKRIIRLTHALCALVRDLENCRAKLIGDGPQRPEVEAILAREGNNLPISLVGRVESREMPEHYRNADVLILLSDYEGLPIAVLEAMAAGVVPVCLRMRSGIPELIEDGVSGLVVDDCEDGVRNALRRLRDEPGLWQRLSRNARERIQGEYDENTSHDAWAELLIERSRARGARRAAIAVPRRISLPPRREALGGGDPRPAEPAPPVRWLRRGRMFLGRMRRNLFSGN